MALILRAGDYHNSQVNCEGPMRWLTAVRRRVRQLRVWALQTLAVVPWEEWWNDDEIIIHKSHRGARGAAPTHLAQPKQSKQHRPSDLRHGAAQTGCRLPAQPHGTHCVLDTEYAGRTQNS